MSAEPTIPRPFWKTYEVGLVPGPTMVPPEVAAAFSINFGSSDLESEFFDYYVHMQRKIQALLHTSNEIVFMSGEAMVTLWGALKSVLKPGDKVLCVGQGLFGEGFGDMAKAVGATAYAENFEWDDPLLTEASVERIRAKIAELKPTLVTAVHCETPCGSINNRLGEIGIAAKENGALFCVDAVSSFVGMPVHVDEWKIDIGLFGSQKALSCPPEFSLLSISDKAWEAIEQVKYAGYDALLPFKTAVQNGEFPYTMSWRSLAALDVSLGLLEKEGYENVYKRHVETQQYTIERLTSIGIKLYLKDSSKSVASPTVTAAYVPEGWTWKEFDSALRAKGVVLGGTYGKIAGKVFRVGHMGFQANMDLLKRGLDAIEEVLKSKK